MSEARKVFRPESSLKTLLAQPGGLTPAEALARVDSHLANLQPECETALMELLEACEVIYEERASKGLARTSTRLYAAALKAAGLGSVCNRPQVDATLTSLFDLLQTPEHDGLDVAIRVHLGAWRVLMTKGIPEDQAQVVVDGLRRVTAKHTGPHAEPAPLAKAS